MFRALIFAALLCIIGHASTLKELKDQYDMGDLYSGLKYALMLHKQGKDKEYSKTLLDLVTANYVPAFKYLGEAFEYGYGVKKSCKKALFFYIGAISAKDMNAKEYIANLYNDKNCKYYNPEIAKRIKNRHMGH